LIPRSSLREERFPESVIPEYFYPSISLGTVRFSNRRESRRDWNWKHCCSGHLVSLLAGLVEYHRQYRFRLG